MAGPPLRGCPGGPKGAQGGPRSGAFYSISLYFILKSIKCTFWLGMLPLQGTPAGKNIVCFIILYTILHNFTETSIKYIFWLGFLPLQGTPTGKNNGVLLYFTLFYIILQTNQ